MPENSSQRYTQKHVVIHFGVKSTDTEQVTAGHAMPSFFLHLLERKRLLFPGRRTTRPELHAMVMAEKRGVSLEEMQKNSASRDPRSRDCSVSCRLNSNESQRASVCSAVNCFPAFSIQEKAQFPR